MKRVNASQILGDAARARTMIPLFVLPFTLLVVLASSTSGDQNFCEIVTGCVADEADWLRTRPFRDGFA